MESRVFTVSTDDGISRDVEATYFSTDEERIVMFYRDDVVVVAMFNLDHVLSVVSVELYAPEE